MMPIHPCIDELRRRFLVFSRIEDIRNVNQYESNGFNAPELSRNRLSVHRPALKITMRGSAAKAGRTDVIHHASIQVMDLGGKKKAGKKNKLTPLLHV